MAQHTLSNAARGAAMGYRLLIGGVLSPALGSAPTTAGVSEIQSTDASRRSSYKVLLSQTGAYVLVWDDQAGTLWGDDSQDVTQRVLNGAPHGLLAALGYKIVAAGVAGSRLTSGLHELQSAVAGMPSVYYVGGLSQSGDFGLIWDDGAGNVTTDDAHPLTTNVQSITLAGGGTLLYVGPGC